MMGMMGFRGRLKTAILLALPLVVVTSVVCPMCSASTMGVDIIASCGRSITAADSRAGAIDSMRSCHSVGSVFIHASAAGASCCFIEAEDGMKQPAAVHSPAPASSVTLYAVRECQLTPSPPRGRAVISPSWPPLGESLYTLHRALLI